MHSHPPHAEPTYSPEHDRHTNVPTLICARLPEVCLLFSSLISLVDHDRDLANGEHIKHLEARYNAARAEHRARKTLHDKLEGELRALPKKKRFQKARRELQARLAGLRDSTPTKGLTMRARCVRETSHGEEYVTLDTAQILGLSAISDRDSLRFVAARVRSAKMLYMLGSIEELHEELAAMHATQSLPYLWRGIPALYSALFGLAYTHQLAHGLPPGSLYYARVRGEHGLYAPTLLLEQRGYARTNQHASRAIKMQVELLKRITLSGEHGGHFFDDVPLLEEARAPREAVDLPAGVRPGQWATLSIPAKLWRLQGEQFAQIPEALLKSHDLYTVNLGLVLKSEEAYKGGRERVDTSGHKLELGRLIDQAGLRQPFRTHESRDKTWLSRALGDLETLGVLTHIETEELERLASEELPTQMELPFKEGPTQDAPRTKSSSRRVPRRRFVSVLAHKKVSIHLYRRVFPQRRDEEHTPPRLPSSG